jgi:hypothetical protein
MLERSIKSNSRRGWDVRCCKANKTPRERSGLEDTMRGCYIGVLYLLTVLGSCSSLGLRILEEVKIGILCSLQDFEKNVHQLLPAPLPLCFITCDL